MDSPPISDEYRAVSLWFDTLPEPVVPAPLDLPTTTVDVAIVGAGFSGLWTAYYLKRQEPALTIAIVEAEVAGFGASGRNGGWCLGESAGLHELMRQDPDRGVPMARALFDTVAEVARVCEREDIDCHYDRGGSLGVAHTPAHADAARAELEHLRTLGFGEEDFEWLDEPAARARVNTRLNHGALHFKHVAAIHPARLVRGLADVVRNLGVTVHELTPATAIGPGTVETTRGVLRARKVLRATEGYTESLRGEQRKILPLYSMMVATEPLPEAVWDEIGLAHRETFSDGRRMVIYGQRTRDNRLAFGGRGGYDYGSRRRRFIGFQDSDVQEVGRILKDIFPVLSDYRLTHGWGGVLGVARHWRPCVEYDRATGVGALGGYVGDGVAATNLAGRTIADLVLERQTPLTGLAWVNDKARRWEPEPLRWLGYSAVKWAAGHADDAEVKGDEPAGLTSAIVRRLLPTG